MKTILKIIPILLICGIAFVAFMCVKTERDYDTRQKQILYGKNKVKTCNIAIQEQVLASKIIQAACIERVKIINKFMEGK